MITVKTFVVNQLQENCYVVSDETGEAVIIDCGAYYAAERQAVANYIRDNKLTLLHLLCTHGHFDHLYGIDTIFQEFGLRPEVHAADRDLVDGLTQQYHDLLGLTYPYPTVESGRLIADGDDIVFGTHKLHAIHTPGHSPGGMVFYCEEEHVAFSGDTLFRMSIGRTDLPGGSWQQLMQSLRHLAATLPPDTKIYAGHGPETTMVDEIRYNPYMK